MTDALIDAQEEEKSFAVHVGPGPEEGGSNNVGYVEQEECEGLKDVMSYDHRVTRPPPCPHQVRGRRCQQPEVLTAGNLFTNLTFDLPQPECAPGRRSSHLRGLTSDSPADGVRDFGET